MEKRLSERVQARVSKETHEKMQREARARGMRVSDLLRWIIGEWYRPKVWRDESRPLRD